MDDPKKNQGAALDDILAELKGKQAHAKTPPTAVPPQAELQTPVSSGGKSAPSAPPSINGQAPPAAPSGDANSLFPTPPAKPKKPGPSATRTLPVFDIGDADAAPGAPRLGKAAALDKVQPDKFADEELLNWFDPAADIHTNKKSMRRAQKEQKRQQAADARQRRKETKAPLSVGDDEPIWAQPEETVDAGTATAAAAQTQSPATTPPGTHAAPREHADTPQRHAPPAESPRAEAPRPPSPQAPPAATPPDAKASTVPVGAGAPATVVTSATSSPRKKGPVTEVLEELHEKAVDANASTDTTAIATAAQGKTPTTAPSAARTNASPTAAARPASAPFFPTTKAPPAPAPRSPGAPPFNGMPKGTPFASQSAFGAGAAGSGSAGTAPGPQAATPPRAPVAPRGAPSPTGATATGRKKGPVTEVLEELHEKQGTAVGAKAPTVAAAHASAAEAKAPTVMGANAPPTDAEKPAPRPTPDFSGVAPFGGQARAGAPSPGTPSRKKGPVTEVLEELHERAVDAKASTDTAAQPKTSAVSPKAAPSAPKAPAAKEPGPAAGGIPSTATTTFTPLRGTEKTATGLAAPQTPPGHTQVFTAAQADEGEDFFAPAGSTIEINIAKVTAMHRQAARAERPGPAEREDTQTYALDEAGEAARVPTAAYTQEFDNAEAPPPPKVEGGKSLFLDDMVDERFQKFFSETVIVEREEIEQAQKLKTRRGRRKSHTALITGEFARLAEQAEIEDDEDFEDYNRPQDAEAIERDILALRTTLTRRVIVTAVAAALLFWLGLGFGGTLPLPGFLSPQGAPVLFSLVYIILIVVAIVLNFTTVATGLVGLVGEPTVDSPTALAAVAGLLQAVVLAVQLNTAQPAVGTLFGGLAALVLAFNCLGKRLRSTAILENFRVASAGHDHCAAYVLGGDHEVAYNITNGLGEDDPAILISRPTALVKGFLRQSFSQRWSDRVGRILGWVILAVAALVGVFCYVQTKDLLQAISALSAAFCLGAPFSSTLLAAVPSRLLQMGTSRVGAVVPGWSAIEELGGVNVVMANAQDVFPSGSVQLRGIKTFEKERVDLAILYAASVLVTACPTLRDVFLGVIQGKSDMLFKVDNILAEPGRGYSAWVENNRVVIGTREMLQKHGIDPPPVELEMKFTQGGLVPVYLAVSGRLFAMFIMSYTADSEVQDTLDGLVQSGVSLLVKSDDMNVTGEVIERVYNLPTGVVKVLTKRELDLLEPLQAYLPESDGAMTHMGSFSSFIGGMRAAAGCAAAERMSGIVQAASVALACVLCFLLVYSGSLAGLGIGIVLLYQLGWTVLVSALPFARRY